MATVDDKPEIDTIEHADVEKSSTAAHEDTAHRLAHQRVELSEEDNIRIRRKTDKRILSVLVWVYFLQIFDKVVFGLGNTWGLTEDLQLTGEQYSMAGSIHAIAQLAWQPFSSYLLVRFPSRHLMTIFVFCWGAFETCMAASTNFRGVYVTRFGLGLFEAGCLPLFGLITSQWYRRSEQPVRIACWYGTNGIATVVAGFISWAFGQIQSDKIHSWQIIYMFAGLITVLTAPVVWFVLDSDIESARFLTPHEKEQTYERLRANQTGTGSHEWKWDQVFEVLLDPKAYLWLGIGMLPNIGAAVTNVFGPTLIKNFGFSTSVSTLLTMPFGALQSIAIIIGCFAAARFRIKSGVLVGLMVIVVVGSTLLYVEGTSANFRQSVALAGYYLLAFLFGGNPIIVSWILANTAGQTKKSVLMALFNAASAVGNIVGPLLFKSKDKPHYTPGVRAVMIIFCALIVIIGLQVVLLFLFNKQRQRQRVAAGKPKHIHDTSMEDKYVAYGADEGTDALGSNALLDMTDIKNNEFTYVY